MAEPGNLIGEKEGNIGNVANGSGDEEVDMWFSWCQTCRHGGHVRHLAEWFGEHDVCPVADCRCTCMTHDRFPL